MLVLSRKPGERLMIGDDVVLVINKIAGNRVTIAIEAPRDVRVVRGELAPLADVTSQAASGPGGLTSPLGDPHVSLASQHAS